MTWTTSRGDAYSPTLSSLPPSPPGIEDIVQIVFLPLYFTLSGLKTDVGSLSRAEDIQSTSLPPFTIAHGFATLHTHPSLPPSLPPSFGLVLCVTLLTAIAAKFIGCSLGAKITGLNWRESASVGVLMNTRGLVELIVLNIGLEVRTEGGREGGRNGLQCAAAS